MGETVYVRLLGEGTEVWRPVPASKVNSTVYRLHGSEIYDPDDEVWEFEPNTEVIVKKKDHEGRSALVAVKEFKG